MDRPALNDQPLAGRRIAVPETRELDVFADLLTRRGADVLRCPLVSILDAPDPAPVLDWIRAFNAGDMDDFIIYTGEGLRRLFSCMDRHAPELREPFLARLAQVRTLTRGPKPAKVLRDSGLRPSLTAAAPTTAGIITTLQTLNLQGRRLGVQIYGENPPPELVKFIYELGTSVRWVAPYRYADAAAEHQVHHLIHELIQNRLDAIAFTSQAQVERLLDVAEKNQSVDALKTSLQQVCVAAVGPIVAESLLQHDIPVSLMPADAYFLKPLTQALVQHFQTAQLTNREHS